MSATGKCVVLLCVTHHKIITKRQDDDKRDALQAAKGDDIGSCQGTGKEMLLKEVNVLVVCHQPLLLGQKGHSHGYHVDMKLHGYTAFHSPMPKSHPWLPEQASGTSKAEHTG
eukprot:526736-Pelagomonas_calceolata.AAC.1